MLQEVKVRTQDLSKKEKIETLDALYTAAGTVRGREAMKTFLRDLLTESERLMLGRRILVARELIAGKAYEEIQTKMSVGSDTIWKIQRWLSDQVPGYEKAILKMEREFSKRKTDAEIAKNFARMKRNYPLHFLLFPYPKSHRRKNNRQC